MVFASIKDLDSIRGSVCARLGALIYGPGRAMITFGKNSPQAYFIESKRWWKFTRICICLLLLLFFFCSTQCTYGYNVTNHVTRAYFNVLLILYFSFPFMARFVFSSISKRKRWRLLALYRCCFCLCLLLELCSKTKVKKSFVTYSVLTSKGNSTGKLHPSHKRCFQIKGQSVTTSLTNFSPAEVF